jgi:2-iminobutanoate/2-iminopropanoate deaminase
MEKHIVTTPQAPTPIGPYSQGVLKNRLLFISGQIPIDPKTGQVLAPDIEAETKQVMENLKAILLQAGMNFGHVMKTTIYLKDMRLFSKVNEVYGIYFESNFPARETVEVSGLPRDVSIQISVIAME